MTEEEQPVRYDREHTQRVGAWIGFGVVASFVVVGGLWQAYPLLGSDDGVSGCERLAEGFVTEPGGRWIVEEPQPGQGAEAGLSVRCAFRHVPTTGGPIALVTLLLMDEGDAVSARRQVDHVPACTGSVNIGPGQIISRQCVTFAPPLPTFEEHAALRRWYAQVTVKLQPPGGVPSNYSDGGRSFVRAGQLGAADPYHAPDVTAYVTDVLDRVSQRCLRLAAEED